MTNKVKACAVMDDAHNDNVQYIALLYIKDESSRVEIHDISVNDNFYNVLNYICNLDDDLSKDDEMIVSILAFDAVVEFGQIMIGLYENRFDNEEIWGDDNGSECGLS